MKSLLIAGLAALVAPTAAFAADMAGTWTIAADFGPKLKYTLMCVLDAAGQNVAGPCIGVNGRLLRASGRVAGDNLRFGYNTDYNGNGVHLDFNGHVQPDGSVSGQVATPLSSGKFEGSRVAESAADHTATWKLNVAFSNQLKYVVLCAFRADGEKLSGPCAVLQGASLPLRGTFDGARADLAYDTDFEGKPAHVEYAGATQADGSLKGSVRSGPATGVFTASKP